MKVGTDGVLLGAWASVKNKPVSILDIGAGTGILSLMLAQRSLAENIEALEIDEDAHEQCVENFEASQWADRLFCYHAGLDEFVEEIEEPYDLIISNPPFYSEDVSSGNSSRDNARQNQSLPFDELLEGVSKLLSTDGIFTFQAYDTKRYASITEEEIIHFLFADQTYHQQENMLYKKIRIIEEKWGLKPTDDLSVIRLIFETQKA